MPLKDFITEVMDLLAHNPDATEILVERVKPQRTAESRGAYDGFYKSFNDRMSAARASENLGSNQ